MRPGSTPRRFLFVREGDGELVAIAGHAGMRTAS
jgi:hypothetical protein